MRSVYPLQGMPLMRETPWQPEGCQGVSRYLYIGRLVDEDAGIQLDEVIDLAGVLL